jgi:hypothetical protein
MPQTLLVECVENGVAGTVRRGAGRCATRRPTRQKTIFYDFLIRNVSTTLIQQGSEFKLCYRASVEWRYGGDAKLRFVLARSGEGRIIVAQGPS